MTTSEVKAKIQHFLETASEKDLINILEYVENIQKENQADARRDFNASKIISEDNGLFHTAC